jgi:hypothetical protein
MRAQTSNGFQNIFRMRTMKTHGDVGEGVEFTLGLVNYCEVRADKSLSTSEESGVTQPAAPPGNLPPLPGTGSGGFI